MSQTGFQLHICQHSMRCRTLAWASIWSAIIIPSHTRYLSCGSWHRSIRGTFNPFALLHSFSTLVSVGLDGSLLPPKPGEKDVLCSMPWGSTDGAGERGAWILKLRTPHRVCPSMSSFSLKMRRFQLQHLRWPQLWHFCKGTEVVSWLGRSQATWAFSGQNQHLILHVETTETMSYAHSEKLCVRIRSPYSAPVSVSNLIYAIDPYRLHCSYPIPR